MWYGDWWLVATHTCDALYALVIATVLVLERRALLDYGCAQLAEPLRSDDWWWRERASGRWTWRILLFYVTRTSIYWVFVQHLVDVVVMDWGGGGGGGVKCTLRTHHMLTLVLCFHVHWFQFLNAYSLPILLAHFVAALLHMHDVYALYLGTYAWSIGVGAYLLVWRRHFVDNPAATTALYLLGALVIVHVLNLLEMGSSGLLYSELALWRGYPCLLASCVALALAGRHYGGGAA